MNYRPSKKEIIFNYIGIILLALGILVNTPISYPEYIPFESEAPNTVAMVIDSLIGNTYKQDLFPDIIGYLILIVSGFIYDFRSKTDNKNTNKKLRYFKATVFLTLALFSHLALLSIPFLTNGRMRFKLFYLLYFITLILKYLGLLEFTRRLVTTNESFEHRSFNTVTLIIIMIGYLCGFISFVLFFYEFHLLSDIYMIIELVLLLLSLYRQIKK